MTATTMTIPEGLRDRLRLSLTVARHCGNRVADIDVDDLVLLLGESGHVCPPRSPLAAALLKNLDEGVLAQLDADLKENLDDPV